MSDLDFRDYVGPARVSAARAEHVARGMEASMPPDADANERAAMAAVVAAATAVQGGLNDRDRLAAGRVRPALTLFGVAWVAMYEILGGLARLGAELSLRGPRAATMLGILFPEGAIFVREDAGAAWASGQRRLDRIEAEGLAPGLVELVGADVLEAVRKTTLGLRVAAGAGPVPRDPGAVLTNELANFSRLLAVYCRLLLAKVDDASPASIERFRRAVLPLAEYRANRRGTEGDEEEDLLAPAAPPANPIPPGMPGSPPFATGA